MKLYIKISYLFFYLPEILEDLVSLFYFSYLNTKMLYHYGIWCSLHLSAKGTGEWRGALTIILPP